MLRENFFEGYFNHRWTHNFTENSPQQEREKWLSGVITSMEKKGVEIGIHKRLDGEGYDFGFLNHEALKTFILDTFDEVMGRFDHTHPFKGYTEGQKIIWTKEATKWARGQGKPFEVTQHWDEIKFTFDRYSIKENFVGQIENFNEIALNKVVYLDFGNHCS